MKRLRWLIGFALVSLPATAPCFAAGAFGITNVPIGSFQQWANAPNIKTLLGDFNGDRRTDLALVGSLQSPLLPIAFSKGDGSFDITDFPIDHGFFVAAGTGGRPLVGDYDGDGRDDIALIGMRDWNAVMIAFSDGDGSFFVDSVTSPFAPWANNWPPASLVGDLDGDGRDDLALTGRTDWSQIPVALSRKSMYSFDFVFVNAANVFATYTSVPNARPLIGDFNGDGKADLAAIGPSGWASLPVAFSNGDGTFNTTNLPIADFATWAATPGVDILPGDFNHDGKMDVALTGVPGWASIPVAFSNGDGTFNVQNQAVSSFPGWAADPSARVFSGDFNGDGKMDIAAIGNTGWNSLPVAFSNGNGTFLVTNRPILELGSWVQMGGTPLLGDFNADGKADLTLKGAAEWAYIPTAFSLTPVGL